MQTTILQNINSNMGINECAMGLWMLFVFAAIVSWECGDK